MERESHPRSDGPKEGAVAYSCADIAAPHKSALDYNYQKLPATQGFYGESR